ncbi:MAG: MATE family efflux transporter [Spirochaetes bacterium]|nr:MATE family efflux transporter [Spirochaetota bacterium]
MSRFPALSLSPRSRTLLALGLPISLAQSAGMVTGLIDTAMLGAYSTTSLAAIGVALTLRQYFLLISAGLSIGIQAALAQSLGRKEAPEGQGAILGTGYLLLALAAVGSTVLLGLFQTSLLDLIGARGEVGAEALSFLTLTLATLLPMFATAGLRAVATAYGRPRLLLGGAAAALAVKGVLDYLLIFGHGGFPAMGIRGAAIAEVASCFAELLVLALGVRAMTHRERSLRPCLRGWKAHARGVGRLSSTTVVEWVLWTTGVFFITKWLLDDDPLHPALYQVSMRVQGLFLILASGFSRAVLTLTAREFGAGNFPAIRQWLRTALLLAGAGLAVCAAAIALFGPAAWEALSPSASRGGVVSLPLFFGLTALLLVLRSVNVITASAIRSMGHVWFFVVVMGISTLWITLGSWGFTHWAHLGVVGVLVAMVVDEASRNAANLMYFNKVTRPAAPETGDGLYAQN